jgi:hypothetical protein
MVEKHAGGRPPFYKSVEEMQAKIDEYFIKSKGEYLTDENGEIVVVKGNVVIVDSYPLTVTGLALALGFLSRQALLNYQEKTEFHDAITRAKLVIEDYANKRLYDKDGVQGAKFTLTNNFEGYKEKQDIEHSGTLQMPVIKIEK